MEKFKIYLYSGIAVLALLVGIYFWGKKNGAGAKKEAPPEDKAWGKDLTKEESEMLVRLTDSLYEDMKGVNVFGWNQDLYRELNALSDNLLVGAAYQFSDKYGESLVSWMKGENFSWGSLQNEGLTDGIIARYKKLNIN